MNDIDDDLGKPKTFYRSYQADNALSDLSAKLRDVIMAESPAHVLDFGCGSGKHLKMLPDTIVKCGLDISLINVINTAVKNEGRFVILGDESHLGHLHYFDVVITCSVLDHIELINRIVHDFKRIARKAVFLAETNDEVGKFYFKHDYEALGFQKLSYAWTGDDGATYNIWEWRKA